MSKDANPPDQFPTEDYDRLSELLDRYSPLDLNGALGLLHAIAVAPSVLPDEIWLPTVIEREHPSGDTALPRYCIELLVRLKAEVQDALEHNQAIIPDDDEIDECTAFAAGYVAGAELDPQWIGDANRWTFASGVAYLADRLDLVPQHTLEAIERNLAPDPKEVIRRQMADVVRAAAETFKSLRTGGQDTDARVSIDSGTTLRGNLNASDHHEPRTAQRQVGRNDPCPCGSGIKFKRCCMA